MYRRVRWPSNDAIPLKKGVRRAVPVWYNTVGKCPFADSILYWEDAFRVEAPIEERARLAILRERGKRDYQVEVGRVYPASAIAGVRIPPGLRVFVALTTCTVQHGHTLQCQWHDWACCRQDGFRVILQSDLVRPGMPIKESVLALLAELQQEEAT